jgi:fatty-acyl-CoA synthase
MCYTSGTTGDPKGVLYSHRSNVIHGLMSALPDAMGIGAKDVILPVVPMFHANAWGLGQSSLIIGAKLVMPGGKMDGASIYELLDTEKVSFTAAVPTVWLMLLQYLEETGKAAAFEEGGHRRLGLPARHDRGFEREYGVEVIHAWGMTEMSPLGSLCTMKPEYAERTGESCSTSSRSRAMRPSASR